MEYKYQYSTIDMNIWNRAKHFVMYKDCGFPFVGVTTNIDMSRLAELCRKQKMRFFRAFMHILVSAVNDSENFRLRIAGDKVVLFDAADPSFTVLDSTTDLFYIAVAEGGGDFNNFDQKVEQAEKHALENTCLSEKRLDLVYMTCLPWFDYSELIQPIFTNASDSVPRLAWGKFKKKGETIEMPFSVSGHHGFIDGVHIARLIEDVGRKIESFVEKYGRS